MSIRSAVAAIALLSFPVANAADPPAAIAVPLLTQALPDIEGKEVTMLTVEYPPGGASQSHRHNANTFVYVLEGAIEMQVKGGALQKLNAGQTFYELPTDVHTVSRNASATQKAKFLVVMIKDKGAPATVPAN